MSGIAFIPLYLNSKIINNLFTIIIEEFSQSQTHSVKEQVVLNIDTPLSEIVQGKYTQGDLRLQVSNEFSKEATEERKVKIISIFIKLMKLLRTNKILKEIRDTEEINDINIGDYITFSCELIEDPIISYFKDVEQKQRFHSYMQELGGETQKNQTISGAKEFLRSYEEETCNKVLIRNCINKNTNFILRIEKSCIETNFNYLFLGPVTVVGKVINILDNKDIYRSDLYSSKFYRYFLKDNLNSRNIYNNMGVHFNNLNKYIFSQDIERFVEVIPLSIYF